MLNIQKELLVVLMSRIFPIGLVGLILVFVGCDKIESPPIKVEASKSIRHAITDIRDGETYEIVSIGNQVWLAENLRYNAKGSIKNSDYPSSVYGRLYDGVAAKEACPDGWHLPTDEEWGELEKALGLPERVASATGWRGQHASQLKSTSGWTQEGNGTNSSGFNAYPAGFYYPADASTDGVGALDGLGASAGFWASGVEGQMWVRFIGAPRHGVNRMPASESDGLMSSCRCVKDGSINAVDK